jgi:phospholipid/cholesterol/gamma-HCH transport system permease protein
MPAGSAPSSALPGARIDSAGEPARVHLSGAWRIHHLAAAERALSGMTLPARVTIDGSALAEIDTAGALALLTRLHAAGADVAALQVTGFSEGSARLFEQVRARFDAVTRPVHPRREPLLAKIGRETLGVIDMARGHLNFLGAVLVEIGRTAFAPQRLRLRELTTQLEQVCLNAIPVVALVTLLIGVVVAYLLGLQAEKYGANIFVVDGVGIGATREFAPIIVAVIVAGRSGAAFTAQLGSMRLNEETDAIRTLGLSPMDVLVMPRVLALMLAMPLLVFIGDVMALAGAMLIAGPMLDITPTTFLARLQDNLAIKHVYVGLAKAPVFALFISVIGCRMGMTVARDTRSLGMATTSTVVQSIVAVILLDAGFAVLFQNLDI